MNTIFQRTITALALFAAVLLTAGTTFAETTITYLINDGLGSPIAAMDEQGAVIWRKDYQPYGGEYTRHPAASDERIGFTGHVQDRSSGLTYMSARYYDPMTGRFMAADPVGFDESNPMSFSRYGYANSNPYSFVDPDGRQSDSVFNRQRCVYEGTCMIMGSPAGRAGGGAGRAGGANSSLRDLYRGNNPLAESKGVGSKSQDVVKSVIKDNRAKKIFRDRDGHLPDTPQSRKLLRDVANDTKAVLGPDKHGNIWSARNLEDGTQAWTQTRNGEIINGGLNMVPRVYNPETGLSSPTRPNWK